MDEGKDTRRTKMLKNNIVLLWIICCAISISTSSYGDIVSEDCSSENTKNLQNHINRILPKSVDNCITHTSEKGKDIISRFSLAAMPFVYFDNEILKSENLINLIRQGMIDKKDDLFYIPQIRLPIGKFFLIGRENLPNRLDLFVMSLCPFGQEAEKVLIEYLRANKLDIDLKIHYIVTFRNYGIDSLYGPQEVHEDIQQLLIQKYYPDVFFDYLLMRNQGKDYADILTELKIDPDKLNNLNQEGIKLLEDNFKITSALNINSSPTILWQNQELFTQFNALSIEEPFTKLPAMSVKGSCQ